MDDECSSPNYIRVGTPVVILVLCVAFFVVWKATEEQRLAREIAGDAEKMLASMMVIKETHQAGESFLRFLRDDHLDTAYEMTTTGFRRTHSPAGFKDFVRRNKALTQADPPLLLAVDFHMTPEGPSPHSFPFKVVTRPDLKTIFRLVIAEEGEEYKVDRLEMGEKK